MRQKLQTRAFEQVITSVAAMARPDLFESDDELDEFLDEVYAAHRANMS